VLLISQSSSQNDICFVVPLAVAKCAVEALRREFRQDLVHEKVEHITIDTTIAIVAVVGEGMRGIPGIVGRILSALGRESVSIIAIAQGSSECNVSLVVGQKDMKAALLAVHQEFQLGSVNAKALPLSSTHSTIDHAESSPTRRPGMAAELAQGMD
jgi:aspartokinase